MSTSQCVGAQDNERENLASPTDQPAEQSVLPPFSGKLSVDEELKLSHDKFKQTIDDFLKNKNIAPLSQLKTTPPFPTSYVLAQFAKKAYTDYERRETDAKYETRLELPEGWKLLTTASNTGRNNGYFGAAYWHPEHQHVVIAHRGTNPKKLGPVWADVQGVLRNKYVGQMESASTFAYKVVEVLREVNHEKRTNFQVFFTGHSLGGWLAQITTFTTEYIKTQGNTFLKCGNVPQSYHPHTVVFDSPGCKNMLSQMADKFDVRLDGRSIDLQHLDITSYLSAPNRVNTCNKHLGTVYRIFVDLSDMSWQEKHTALYNLATHSMDKIVEVFDPKTQQGLKYENGELKLQMVIDWPVSAGLSRGKEYKSFFKWAKQLNNYHKEIAVKNFPLMGYYPIRYQTKNYDERVTSISIFSHEERQFLEDYRRLCQLPEFFKPKEMFCAIGNEQAQKQAEIILQGFEIENETIRSTDASALQAHIPYVKRLLQLFPEIKENTKHALSPHQIRNNVYQIGTKRYLEKLHQSTLHFRPDALSLRDFLNSDEQKVLHLRMVDGEAWTGLIKVYQVLEKTTSMTDFLSEGYYTVLTLQHLLLVNPMVNLNTLMESTTTPHLLMMSCETNQQPNDETKQIFESLFNTLKQKPSVKVILTTQSEGDTVTFLQDVAKETLSNGFVTRDEQLTGSDLTQSSQEKLLENAVNFQGSEIALNQLISPDSSVTNFLPLADLLEKKHLTIDEEQVAYSKYNFYDERYYIDRTFHHQVVIKQDVLNDNRQQKFPDLLASTEQEFKQLRQQNPKRNVHWLERDKSGKLVWQQSQGSLEALRKYIDTDSPHTYTPDDLEKVLEQAQPQRVMLISDTAGMGKSTVLTHLSKQIKQTFPAKWVVRIDLNDHTDALHALQEEEIGKEKAINFVSQKILKLKPGFEVQLFKQCCEQKQKVNIVIMLDGFDEVSPSYKETVIALLQALRQTAVEQLWVTTRPHLRHELEDKLQQLSYTLEPFSLENQVEFLTKFWILKDWFTDMGSKEKEEKKVKLETYAKDLIKKLAKKVSDKDKKFTGNPLHCRMLAEAFDEEVKTFYQSAESVPPLPSHLDLLGLYERFMNRKYVISVAEKSKFSMTNVGATVVRTQYVKNIIEDHQMLALKLFGEEKVAHQIKSQCTSSDEDITRIGIVQVSHDGKLHFIHRTFAEYYIADYIVNQLTKVLNTSQQVQELLLKKIFLVEDYQLVRVFIDALLLKSKPSEKVLKQYGNRIRDLLRNGVPILHQVAREDNLYIIKYLIDCVQAGEHTDTLNELLLAQDNYGRNAWHLAAECGNTEVLVMLWESAEGTLAAEELHMELLLAKDCKELTAWHYALLRSKVEALQKLWDWGKDTLTAEELNNKFLLAKDNIGRTALNMVTEKGTLEVTLKLGEMISEIQIVEELFKQSVIAEDMKETAWHLAAGGGNIQELDKLWDSAKEKLTRGELVHKFLLAKDYKERTAWHHASLRGNLEALQKLWEWGKETLTEEELNNNLLLAKDNDRKTAWHLAAAEGKLEILQKLWEWGREKLTAEELKNRMLLAKDNEERTAWHYTSLEGNPQALQKLWEWGKETLTAEELNNKLLIAKDNSERTAWHYAAVRGNHEVLQKMWEWGKETLIEEELNNKLLVAKNNMEQSAWHLGAETGNIEILQKLWEWGKETLTPEELSNKLLLAKDNRERTAWLSAAEKGNLEILQKMWEWGKVALTAEELKYKLLLAKDEKEETAWHLASRMICEEVLQKLWDCSKETLTVEEIKNKLLLAKNSNELIAWHHASRWGKIELLNKLWEWGKETLTAHELKNKLLLAKDILGLTAWHMAAEKGNLEVLQKLWEWGKETLTAEELNYRLFLAKDNEERTAWHYASSRDNVEVLQKLWERGKENLTAEELKIKLLLGKDKVEQTAWHYASSRGNVEVLKKLWEWGKETLKVEEISNKLLLDEDNEGQTAWHYASQRGHVEALQKLWECGKETLTAEELNNKLLLAKDNREQTAWHYAAEKGDINVLQKMWEWGKETLTGEELNNKLLLAKDKMEHTAWHLAAVTDNVEVLQHLWEWGKKQLTAEDLNNKLLLVKGCDGKTAWHLAANKGNIEILQKLWEWGKCTLTAEELNNKLLLDKTCEEQTAWHCASVGGSVEALQNLWEWGKETLTAEELNNKLLLAKDNEGQTAWHYASCWGKLLELQKLWECGKETLSAEDLNNKLLLAKDNREQSAWHLAANKGNIEILQKLWEWGKCTLTAEELNNKLLLDKTCGEQTAWHCASLGGSVEALQKLWEWGKETLTAEELNNKMLLAKDHMEQAAWHYATWWGKLDVLQELWECGKESLTAEDLNNNLLLAKNCDGLSAWHLAAMKGNVEILQKLWEWGKETLTAEEINNKLLLDRNCGEETAWHCASSVGSVEVLQKLWEWGKKQLTAEDLNNNLLLAKDCDGKTAWHLAAMKGNIEILQKLWEWGKETLTAEELSNKLLLTKDNRERTACYYAATRGHHEVLRKMWEWVKRHE